MNNVSKFKCDIHKLRKRRDGTRLPYVCLECGKEFKILNGILVARTNAEQEDYFKRRRALLLAVGLGVDVARKPKPVEGASR